MAETVGRVDFMAALDANNAVRESRALGEKIGQEGDKAGADFGDNFDSELSPRMRETTSKLGKMLNESLTLDNGVMRRNSNAIRLMGQDGESALDRLSNRMFAFGVAAEDAFHKIPRKVWDDLDAGSARLDGLNIQWKDLSHNTRQWTLIIGAVMASLQDLSVLGSAAGAGLFAVGGGLSAAVLGAGAAVAVFSVLAKDIGDLPPALQGTASQFKALGTALVGTRDIIASAAIQQMPDTFARLQGTVEALNPSLGRLGGSVGTVFDRFSRGVEEGTAGFEELEKLVDNAADDFPKLASAAGNWSVGLLRGLNKANPLVDQLIGYVDKLGDRFDDFTRSNSFDQWVANSSATWTDFGELLDATGRALNDLVTPASIQRTQLFLDNLTSFMPNLSQLLDVLGRVNVFGLAAEALDEFGQALSPLAGPAGELADSLNDIGTIVIEKLASSLRIAAEVAEPLAQGLANVITAIPEPALDALATGVVAVATAFVVLKGVQGVAGAVAALGVFTTTATAAEVSAGKLAAGLKTGLGKAGAIGLAVVGVAALSSALVEAMENMYGLDDAARDAVTGQDSLADAMSKVYVGSKDITSSMDDVLNRMGELDNFFVYITALDAVGGEAVQLSTSLQKLSPELANLANNDVEAATSQFASWAEELGASDKQVLNMLESMPEFKQAIIDAAEAAGMQVDSQSLVSLALGETKIGIDSNTSALDLLSTSAVLTGAQIDALGEQIRNFGTQNLTARDAARTYEEALDTLTESIVTNGITLDIGTAAGRANEAALDAVAVATLDLSAKTLAQTGSQQEANVKIAEGRERLIEMLAQLGITGAEAEGYADKLGLIPADVSTYVSIPGGYEAEQIAVRVGSAVRNIPQTWVTKLTVEQGNLNYGQFTPRLAAGTVTHGPMHALIGEAGPEAVVPLNRPLNQVDPSVRWLSAIAQGKIPGMASGGVGGNSKTVIFEAGAIVVEGVDDPREAALEVADAVAERVGS